MRTAATSTTASNAPATQPRGSPATWEMRVSDMDLDKLDHRKVVGIVMGSDSDWPVMKAAGEVLDELGIGWEADVVSAHRMPEDMIAWGKAAADRGLKVVIAGAGGAAHLPGMLASVTTLPVIGV